MFYVYILYSRKYLKSYVGMTSDIEKRLSEHNAKKSICTSKYTPWVVVHKEEYTTRQDARKKEKY